MFLHIAIKEGNFKIVRNLLKHSVDVNYLYNSKFEIDMTPLHNAAKNKREEIGKLLISYGGNINAQDNAGKTPLFYAINNADLNFVKLLLSNGANVKDNPELLNNAVNKNSLEIVEALIHYNVDINAIDENGRTALHFTTLNESIDFCVNSSVEDDVINAKVKIAKLLLSNGANVDAVTKTGLTALHIATEKGYIKIVTALLEYNANVNCKLKNGFTPLHIAAEKGFLEIVEILLKFGADVSSADNYCRTALYFAIDKNHNDVFSILLEYGSVFNFIRNNNTIIFVPSTIRKNSVNTDTKSDRGDQIDPINPFDECHQSDLSDIAIETFKRQIIKLKAANLYISKANLQVIRSSDMSEFRVKCEEEIAKMNNEKIGVKISFYDILIKHTNSLATYMKNENIVQVLKSESYITKFPIYADKITCNFRKAMYRKELLEKNNKMFNFVLNNNTVELPLDCIEIIVSYLNEEDVRSLIKASSSFKYS